MRRVQVGVYGFCCIGVQGFIAALLVSYCKGSEVICCRWRRETCIQTRELPFRVRHASVHVACHAGVLQRLLASDGGAISGPCAARGGREVRNAL